MKAILRFDMSDPDEASDFNTALNGSRYKQSLWDLDQYFRSRLKYEELTEEVHNALQAARDKLHECLNGLELD